MFASSSLKHVENAQIIKLGRYDAYVFDFSKGDPSPTRIVYFHGRGGRAEPVGYPVVADEPVVILVPQATETLGEGFAWTQKSVTSKDWNELSMGLWQAAREMASTLKKARRSEHERFVLAGFSQGAMLALTLALFHADLVHGAVVGAAYLPEPLVPQRCATWQRHVRIRAINAAQDPVVPGSDFLQTAETLRSLGFDVVAQTRPYDQHAMNADMQAQFAAWMRELLRHVANPFPAASGNT